MRTRLLPRATRAIAGARGVRFAVAGLLLLGAPLATGAQDFPIALEARSVPLADKLALGDRVGRLRFLGMLELPTVQVGDARLSQLSGLAWDDDDGILYAVSDKGWLFHLRPELQGDMLRSVQLLNAVPLRELGSNKPLRGKRADAEGLDIVNGRNGRPGDAELLIGFERLPRIMRYRPDGNALSEQAFPAPLNDPRSYRSSNKMVEALCLDAKLGVLVAPEVPLAGEREDETRIYSLSGESWRYPLQPGHRITAMECLGAGEVLVLETDFGRLLAHSAIELKLARLASNPGKNAAAQIETVAQLDTGRGYAIDNFEGLTRHRGMRFFVVTDDNDLFFQRTLMLYIELLPTER
jgi:hypothetical protein